MERIDPLGARWLFAYDSRDNLTETLDATDQRILRGYDALSRLLTVESVRADGVREDLVAFAYDPAGNRTGATDSDSALDFAYDGLNRLVAAATRDAAAWPGAVQPAVVLTSTYDAVGNRSGLTHGPDAATVAGAWTYGHDGAGRLASLVHPAGDPLNPVALAYDPAGRLSAIAFPNGVATNVAWDAAGRPGSIVHAQGSFELARYDYGYTADGLIDTIAEPTGTRAFEYDATQQLTAGGTAAAPESYSYDQEGNRLASHLSAAHQHDAANRLLSDDAFCYAYDANGNLTTKTARVLGVCDGPITSYSWDVHNRLVRIDFFDGTHAAYRYDADGRRIGKNVDGALTRYVYDDDAILLEYDGTATLLARYGHGLEVDQPLVMERGGESYFYQTDHLGSVRLLTAGTGTAVNRYVYDAYGDPGPSTVMAIASPFAFTAREFDPESALHYYRARYYDPVSAHFISRDPMGCKAKDLNLYRYVLNNPTNFIDPSGKLTLVEYNLIALLTFSVAYALAYEIFDPTQPLPDPTKGTSGTIQTRIDPFYEKRPLPDCDAVLDLCMGACAATRFGLIGRVACATKCVAIALVCYAEL